MSLNLKILGVGTLATPATPPSPLYPAGGTVQAGKMALVKSLILTNTGSGTATVNLYVQQQAAGTQGQISPRDLQLAPGAQFILDSEIALFLSTGPDVIRGSANPATVDYVISGIERDV